jgi:hypothetical protein
MTRGAAILLAAVAVSGCMKNHLVFGTVTKFALDISQRPDQTIDVTMGYDRGELASIPTAKNQDASPREDAYSVIGTFHVKYGNPWTEGLRLNQFFATGQSAVTAARTERFRKFFGHAAGVIVAEGVENRPAEAPTTPPAGGR